MTEGEREYEVHVYYDGPYIHDDAVIRLKAMSKTDAIREAVILTGPPKIADVREIT